MSLGIILVHGYSGSNLDLKPLAETLSLKFDNDSVRNIFLPGHDPVSIKQQIPEFEENLFLDTLHQVIQHFQTEKRKLILIGHSTGGNIILSAIRRFSIKPDLLILISVPRKIDGSYFERWASHRQGELTIPLTDVAMMIKFINTTGTEPLAIEFPVLIIHGENDGLVPFNEAYAWKNETCSAKPRVVIYPDGDHHLITGNQSHLLIDLIERTISDISNHNTVDQTAITTLSQIEPKLNEFFIQNPLAQSHLAVSPSGQHVMGKEPVFCKFAKNEPVIANIEITTLCNLTCKFCARSQMSKGNKHMSFDQFSHILNTLPNIYKIVLVGLGEPLIHPGIAQFIKYGKSLKKTVGLVTNAMLLTPEVSLRLIEAGLDSITFSIDGFDPTISSRVRAGTDFLKLVNNITEFIKLANSTRKLSTAVFSAVSFDTVAYLTDLIDLVTKLGVDVIMLSDINFKANLNHTLWQNMNVQVETEVKKAVKFAFSKNLPVLSVHGLEEFGLEQRYHHYLLIPPSQLGKRSTKRTWCTSPWQTVPIDVDGNITLCDCQPETVIGNLFQDAFSSIWNGHQMQQYRIEMLSSNPPEACKICPRF